MGTPSFITCVDRGVRSSLDRQEERQKADQRCESAAQSRSFNVIAQHPSNLQSKDAHNHTHNRAQKKAPPPSPSVTGFWGCAITGITAQLQRGTLGCSVRGPFWLWRPACPATFRQFHRASGNPMTARDVWLQSGRIGACRNCLRWWKSGLFSIWRLSPSSCGTADHPRIGGGIDPIRVNFRSNSQRLSGQGSPIMRNPTRPVTARPRRDSPSGS